MDDLDFLPGASGAVVAAALKHVAMNAGNVRGCGPRASAASYLTAYLEWTENAELELGNTLGVTSVDALVRTPGYWALRALDGDSPGLVRLVTRECDRQRLRLDRMAQDLLEEIRRWKQATAKLVVPDTNMFLDSELPFATIDWASMFDAHIVRIIVPLVVVHELDRLKRQGNQLTARAARDALRWLLDVLPTRPGEKSRNLTPGPRTTVIEVFVDQGPMRRPDADGDIIAFATRLGVLSDLPTMLVTRDLGMQLRAKAVAVEALQLIDPPVLAGTIAKA